jgi:hypothetical protein
MKAPSPIIVLSTGMSTEFSGKLNKFINAMAEAYQFQRMQNLTTLYVPREIVNMPVDVASRDKELCGRLEGTYE